MALSKIQAESMNLADTYAFSGSVSGASAEHKIAHTSTTTNRTLNGATGWVDHLSVTFTTTQIVTLHCIGQFAHGYEQEAMYMQGRFDLDGSSQSDELQIFKQGQGAYMAYGSHNLTGFFTNVSAGSHTIKLQVKNGVAGTIGIMNYFDDANNGDHIWVMYK
tara:strand:- start:202 stop:687 length:486 start_codon:yes stop_codon:yes gene_type:complete